ncbi:MAG: XRE family transcriptional regulator [Actinobacteria bacterium]|nr:MAG: XRE family transcriptional regulator [Actinomycetota bacterium]
MQTAEPRVVEHVHRQAIETSVPDIAATLQDILSRRLVAYVAGVKDAKTVSRWANGEVAARDESEKRLRVAFEIAQLLLQFDSPRVVKAWFIGLNPQLGDVSPADTIRDGKLKEAMIAARAFVTGG